MYFILDLDLTITTHSDRHIFFTSEPKNYAAAEASVKHDIPHDPMFVIAKSFIAQGYECIVLTARGESSREESSAWLEKIGVSVTEMFMRASGDTRKDYIIKEEILEEIIEKYGTPFCAFDDRQDVIDMYHRLGISSFQIRIGI